MKARPILMSAPMVRALLEGRKTQTRRMVKPKYIPIVEECLRVNGKWVFDTLDYELTTPYGKPGDVLWVRESIWLPPIITSKMERDGADTWPKCIYMANGDWHNQREDIGIILPKKSIETDVTFERDWCKEHRWKSTPSIHMPRWASRLTLEITDVRVERLHECSGEDSKAEGVNDLCSYIPVGNSIYPPVMLDYKTGYKRLWESINGAGSWDANPWVWALKFKVHQQNVDAFGKYMEAKNALDKYKPRTKGE